MTKKQFPIKNIFILTLFLFWVTFIFTAPHLSGQTIEDMYLRGLRSGQQGELRGAELHFKNALSMNPFYIPARRALDVINDFRHGLVDRETTVLLFNGMEYHRKWEFTTAINEYKRAVKNAPEYYLALHNLGVAYYEDGQNSRSITQYKKALKLNPRYPYTHNNLGLAYVRSNKPYKAIIHYKRAIELDPTYYKAYNNLGAALFIVKKIDEAYAMFRKSLNVNPNYTLGYINFLRDYKKENFDTHEIEAAQSLSLEELLKQIEKGDYQERSIAAQALTFHNDSGTIRKTLKLLKHPDPLNRVTSAKILGDLKARTAVDSLINCSEDTDWTVRMGIVCALGKIKDKRALDSLHRSLLEDSSYHVRIEAANALYRLRDPSSIGPLDKALQDRIPEVRNMALWILANAFDKNGYYRSMLEEQKNNRNSAPESGEQQTTDLQTLLLNGDWDQMNRLGEPAVDFLIESLEKGDSDLRIDIIIGLGYIGNEKAIDALTKQLQNNNADIRFYAAEALGKFNNMKAVPPLIELLSDSHWKVKAQAVDSLRRITNLFLGDDPEEWRNWWQKNH